MLDDVAELRASAPDVWRSVRRFNTPVQLAVGVAQRLASSTLDRSNADLVALAPCQAGSPELYRSASELAAYDDRVGRGFRLNPTYTLHAVDNLALSAVSIAFGNRACGMGFGGAAGQAWEALEWIQQRMAEASSVEALLFAGDQEDSKRGSAALGAGLLLSNQPTRFADTDRRVELSGLEWSPTAEGPRVQPHAARGLAELLSALDRAELGEFRYSVPVDQTDGRSRVELRGVISCSAS